jgi:hypothetical protein
LGKAVITADMVDRRCLTHFGPSAERWVASVRATTLLVVRKFLGRNPVRTLAVTIPSARAYNLTCKVWGDRDVDAIMSDRWRQAATFRERAAECVRLSEIDSNSEIQLGYRRLAEAYLTMANYEISCAVEAWYTSHPFGHDTRDRIRPAARSDRHDHGDRARRIGLRARVARNGRKNGSAGCET